jgi:RND family efflux transporter MFP subunit
MTIPHRPTLAGCLALLLLAGCAEEAPPPETPLRPVRWIAASLVDGTRLRSFSGSAKASTESTLSFKVAGTVQSLPVQVGDRVTAGQLIAEIDPRDYELQVQEADAALVDTQAQAREAAANHERYRLLYEADNTSKAELDAARATDESAAAAVTASRKRLEIAQLQLGYTRLMAPIDGAIAETFVNVNENVGQGAPIADLSSGSRIEVDVAVPEVLIAQVQPNSACVVTFDALPERSFDATVTEVGVVSTGLQTTFPVTVRLNAAVADVRPGMAAVVRLALEDADTRPRVLVPAVAVSEDRGGRFVYVVLDDGPNQGRIERRDVVLGDITAGGELEVFEGIDSGDRVVTRGMTKVSDGMSVRLPESGAGR